MNLSKDAGNDTHQDLSLLPSSSSVRSTAKCSRESLVEDIVSMPSEAGFGAQGTEADNDAVCGDYDDDRLSSFEESPGDFTFGAHDSRADDDAVLVDKGFSSFGSPAESPYEVTSSSRQGGQSQRDEFGAVQRFPSSLLGDVPFPSWVEQFLRQIIGARTSFSYFVLQSISTCRRGRDDSSATDLYPIPVPFVDIFGVGPQRMSQRRRQLLALKKLLHLVVVALNYEYFRSPFSVMHLLRRRPSALHLQVYGRLWAFVRSCGLPGSISVSGCGRKKFQLDARLSELSGCLEAMGLDERSKYHQSFHGVPVPVNNEEVEELRPYRDLVASRMKLTGQGNWHCVDFLSDLLFMPFVEPRVNRFDIVPPPNTFPDVLGGDVEEVAKLCRVWDANDLLTLIPEHLGPDEHELHLFTKVFANYKSSSVDRQIGDRRGANFTEGKLDGGPSQKLPTGAALLQIEAKRFEEVIVGAAAHKKTSITSFM